MTTETTSKMPAGTLCPHAFNSLAELNAMKHSTILKHLYELAHMCAHMCLCVCTLILMCGYTLKM